MKKDNGPFDGPSTLADVNVGGGIVEDTGEVTTLCGYNSTKTAPVPGCTAFVPTPTPGAPWYRLTGQAFIDGRLYEAGEVVQFSGPPNLVMELVEDEEPEESPKPKRKAIRRNDDLVI